MMLPTKFRFIWESGCRGDFLEINQSETRIACGGHVCLWVGIYRRPSKDASYQVLDHLAKGIKDEDFLEINQSETRIACGGHVC
jgi:hypothetical protein